MLSSCDCLQSSPEHGAWCRWAGGVFVNRTYFQGFTQRRLFIEIYSFQFPTGRWRAEWAVTFLDACPWEFMHRCACVHTLALLLHQSITWRSVFQTYRLLYLTHSRCSIDASWADFPVVLALLPRSSISGGFKANNIALVFLMNLIQNLKSWETRNILQENQIYIRSMKSWNRNIFVLFSPLSLSLALAFEKSHGLERRKNTSIRESEVARCQD